jgi:hypothetical protein
MREMEMVGSVIRRCLEATENGKFYRPQRAFKHRKQKSEPVQSQQLQFKFPEPIRSTERPLVDLIPEAYQ